MRPVHPLSLVRVATGVVAFTLFCPVVVLGAERERTPAPRPGTQRTRPAYAGTAYEGKSPGGVVVLMEFLDLVRVHVTAGTESFDGMYFAQPDSITIMVGREKVVWSVKGDTLESKTDGEGVTVLTKKTETAEADPAAAEALAGTKYTAQNPSGRPVAVEFVDRQKARLTLGPGGALEGTFRANAQRIVVLVSGNAFLFVRNGEVLECKFYGDTPMRFVKE